MTKFTPREWTACAVGWGVGFGLFALGFGVWSVAFAFVATGAAAAALGLFND
jgi:hypothetical protein